MNVGFVCKQQISIESKKTAFNSNTFTKMDRSFINKIEFNLFIVLIALPHNNKRKRFNKIKKFNNFWAFDLSSFNKEMSCFIKTTNL